ncbi:hypothetical protein ASPZODRAFT_55006 [Penicilliopsis zonata CBS 506.65]|uniref:Uncharacterized protein n=1 Tax=Penicilliopsis zonata CBS 506.65 TaxID=1073090 RepID=A0A1L9SUR9_9EURO|nr:hypothetical protein ASPZODRAFT_55006 [Penicilliopsis zonata CBS 506.65]OJJ50939.1 hypothetical protein ASPZODRAFT_55006 [Penicilliopsis zonata CBS 506.65]
MPVNKQLPNKVVSLDAQEGEASDDDDSFSSASSITYSEYGDLGIEFRQEKSDRLGNAIGESHSAWSEGERELFMRLAMRGFEPIVPKDWRLDFATLPKLLFARSVRESSLISAVKRGSSFYAIKSLSRLCTLGGRVRDCDVRRISPAHVIKRGVDNYLNWAFYDGSLKARSRALRTHVFYTKKRREATRDALERVNRRLCALAQRYQDAAIMGTTSTPAEAEAAEGEGTGMEPVHTVTFPILVGFLVCGPLLVIVTLDSTPTSNAVMRFICQFDMGESGQDVWNALAVAIAVMHIRTTMRTIEAEWQQGLWNLPDGRRGGEDLDF